jgi:Mrp family chromosome partitioning ATPase
VVKAGSLERTLDRTIDALSTGPQTREARALLIEARRLRSVVGNWRSIPPPSDVRDEMIERVIQLSTAVGADARVDLDDSVDGPSADPDVSIAAGDDHDDDAYSLDFEPHLYSLEGITTQRQAIPPPATRPPPAAPGYPSIDFEPAGIRPMLDDEIPIPQAPLGRRPGRPEPAPTAPRAIGARPASIPPPPFLPPPPIAASPPPRVAEAPRALGVGDPTPPRRPQARWSEAPPPKRATPPSPVPPTRTSSIPPPLRASSAPPPARASSAPPPARTSSAPPALDRASSIPVPSLPLPKPSLPQMPAQAAPAPRASEPPPRPSPPPIASEAPPRPSPPPDEPEPFVDEPPRKAAAPPRADLGLEPPETGDLGVPRTRVTAEAVTLADPLPSTLVFLTSQYGKSADVYRAMRRKLAGSGNPRVIAVTSAQAGEGKTIFALNLALALREGARGRVLVIEANHRAPSFSKLLGFSPSVCVLHQLAQHVEDARAPWIAQEPMPKLHVMAIDPKLPREPLLDALAWSTGMERIKQAGYDYIVVDSPPVLGSVDCNVISDSVEATIFTAMTMKSKRKEMRKAVEQLEPSPILGVVVVEA